MGLPNNGTLKTLLASSGITIAIVVAIFGYGRLDSTVEVNAKDIGQLENRVDDVEDRAGDVRERLKGIEVTQQQQNETLKRILRAVESKTFP